LIRLLIALMIAAAPVAAEEVVGALSQNTVAITTNFDGSEIFVFGAVKREAPVAEGAGPLHVVITIRGPSERVVVRRKERTLGIWVNRDSVEVDEAPSFYAIATTGPLNEVMSETARLTHRIGFDKAVRIVGAPDNVESPRSFSEAVVRIRQDNGLYKQQDGIVDLRDETLFATNVALPANLTEGVYRTRMFLLRDREVLSWSEAEIVVQKEGLERLIYRMAHEQPLYYGLLSLAVALAAGWLASEVFRLLRR